jgi:hypothetical protein
MEMMAHIVSRWIESDHSHRSIALQLGRYGRILRFAAYPESLIACQILARTRHRLACRTTIGEIGSSTDFEWNIHYWGV